MKLLGGFILSLNVMLASFASADAWAQEAQDETSKAVEGASPTYSNLGTVGLKKSKVTTGIAGLKEAESPWTAFVRYSVASDFADSRYPRAYTNWMVGSLGYTFQKTWTVSGEFGAKADFLNGQIDKGSEQSYSEVVNPTTSLDLEYATEFGSQTKAAFDIHGEPLWDEASRRDGYVGIYGAGAAINFSFFNKVYSMSHTLDYSELSNSYFYSASGKVNAGNYLVYRFGNSIRFLKTWKASYTFGLKTTRYVDDTLTYSYSNSLAISKTWQKITVALSYDNGGFTDRGEVELWYLDIYRRIYRLSLNYAF